MRIAPLGVVSSQQTVSNSAPPTSKRKGMPPITPRRLKAARIYGSSPAVSKTSALRQAGFSETTSRNDQGTVFSAPTVIAEVERTRERMKQALLKAGVDEHRIARRISSIIDSDNETAAIGAIDRACRLLGLSDDDDSGRRVITVLIGQFSAVVQAHAPAALASRILRALAETGNGEPRRVIQLNPSHEAVETAATPTVEVPATPPLPNEGKPTQ